ncbi:MAG: hypothetical protein N2Z22_07325, partial [Turneriella sp.]|nr:hypothetical protein [Turneriella sp.]
MRILWYMALVLTLACKTYLGQADKDKSGQPLYTVGGTVTGLSGTLVLQNNGGDDLILTADGNFTFATALPNGATYHVTIFTQPTGKFCEVANESGQISGSNVTNVLVICVNLYTVGGTVFGLSGTLVLQNNGGDNLTLTADGSFTFATPVPDGRVYNVTVLTNPTGRVCMVDRNAGTIAGANVTNVTVQCATDTTWYQDAYLKTSNIEPDDFLGYSVAISGNTIAAGILYEDSGQTTITNDNNVAPTDSGKPQSGAVAIFKRDSMGNWYQDAFLKASNADE